MYFANKSTAEISYWDRGRLARREHRKCDSPATDSILNTVLALRARGGRDARGPSEELPNFVGTAETREATEVDLSFAAK